MGREISGGVEKVVGACDEGVGMEVMDGRGMSEWVLGRECRGVGCRKYRDGQGMHRRGEVRTVCI